MNPNVEQKDVWNLEDVEMERETYELLKHGKSNFTVLEFTNINTQ
jgi:hypothetical protein